MKHNIKASWRGFAAVYLAILIGVLVVPTILNINSSPFIAMFAGIITIALITTTIAVTIGYLFRIFNANIYSKEGFLTMTLPVKSYQILFSKLLISVLWVGLTALVSTIALFIFSSISGTQYFYFEIGNHIHFFLGKNQPIFLLSVVILGIISIAKEISKLFLACSIAQLKMLNRFRVPAGILSYFILSWIESIIVKIAGMIFVFIPFYQNIIDQMNSLNQINNLSQVTSGFLLFLSLAAAYGLVLFGIYNAINLWILDHKLDLE